MHIIESETSTLELADAMRKLADYVEADSAADVAVVCVMRRGSEVRLYALGDDTEAAIHQAGAMIDGAIQAIMINSERRH